MKSKLTLVDGGRTRARTLDPLIKSQLLYQLSYAPIDPAMRRSRRDSKRLGPCPAFAMKKGRTWVRPLPIR